MKRLQTYISIAIILCFGLACEHEKPVVVKPPQNLLSHKVVSAILADMHLTEAMLSQNSLTTDSLNRSAMGQYALIYKRHGVSEQDFKASFQYYRLQPVEIDSIYSDVITRLSEQESKLTPLPLPDSSTIVR